MVMTVGLIDSHAYKESLRPPKPDSASPASKHYHYHIHDGPRARQETPQSSCSPSTCDLYAFPAIPRGYRHRPRPPVRDESIMGPLIFAFSFYNISVIQTSNTQPRSPLEPAVQPDSALHARIWQRGLLAARGRMDRASHPRGAVLSGPRPLPRYRAL